MQEPVTDSDSPESTREAWLAAHSIINGVMAADCLYDEECVMNNTKFREALTKLIKATVSPGQCENLVAVLNECQRDEQWMGGPGIRRW